MSWIQRLYETYESCAEAPQFARDPPMPVGHTQQQAHIEIVIDQGGNFVRAGVVQKVETTVPATEESAGRTRKAVPHALCDKIQYCAGDYVVFGGAKDFGFPEYLQQLRDWVDFDPNPKSSAVLRYVSKATVVRDLVLAQVLYVDSKGTLLTEWLGPPPVPDIFRLLTADAKTKQRDQGSAFVRWRVQIPGDASSGVWEDGSLRESWIRYYAGRAAENALCFVTGEMVALAVNHPKRVRHPGDGAKLLSSNDEAGYTFRGRFESSTQAYGVGSIVSQKAHNALRWLVARQGYKSGDQVFVSWAIGGALIPDPLSNSADLFGAVAAEPGTLLIPEFVGDVGQHFAMRLTAAVAGFRAKLSGSERVAILGLNSATPGRMAITYYRELEGQEFLDRIVAWHSAAAWSQNFGKDRQFVGVPAPKEIAEAAYGRRIDEKLRCATVERLLPCIIDGRPVPRDLVISVVRRSCNRAGSEIWEWNRTLGVACSLVRVSQKEEAYSMSLEEGRNSRDYLYGRLLAVAENIEERALHAVNEKRETSAAKLMQRFSSRPCSTWRNLELALIPYKNRLRSKRPSVLLEREKLLDAVMEQFQPGEFIDDGALSGEFLLGYHCQRAALWKRGGIDANSAEAEKISEDGASE